MLWKAGGTPIDFSLRPEWVDFLNKTLFFHLFDMFSLDYPGTWAIVLGGLATLGLFFAAWPPTNPTPAAATARNFIYAGIIVLAVHVIAVYFLPVTILIQSQILRMGLWILILAYLFFANFLAQLYQRQTHPRPVFALLTGVFIFSPTPILTLAAWALARWSRREVVTRAALVLFPLLIIASYATVWMMGFWNPLGLYLYGQPTPWVEVQRWARDNTPAEARFITPPEKWGPQESDWRVHSERASIGTLSEMLVAAFQPGYEIEWQTRFERIAPGALAQFDGDYFHNVHLTREAYNNLSAQDLLTLSCDFDAQYAVIEKPNQHPLPVAYENSQFWVYRLSEFNCP